MFKKRVIILFFTLFLFNLNGEDSKNISDKKYIDDAYEKDTKIFFANGIIEYNEETIDFSLYKEKNKFKKYNFSLSINDNVYKIVSKKTSTSYYLNDNEIEKDYKLEKLGIPLNILNDSLINRDFILISKSNKTQFKNIPCNKLLIKEKKPEVITESPVTEIVPSNDSELTQLTDSEELEMTELTGSDESITDSKDVLVEKVEYEKAIYPKVIYYIAAKSSTILKKEFYLEKENKLPDYIITAESVSYINNKYFETEFKISDKKEKSITFKYNIETILLDKKLIEEKFNNMIFFNGAI